MLWSFTGLFSLVFNQDYLKGNLKYALELSYTLNCLIKIVFKNKQSHALELSLALFLISQWTRIGNQWRCVLKLSRTSFCTSPLEIHWKHMYIILWSPPRLSQIVFDFRSVFPKKTSNCYGFLLGSFLYFFMELKLN